MKTKNLLRAAAVVGPLVRLVRKPRKGRMERATDWMTQRLPGRQRRSRTSLMAGGLGAAAVALPLGLWVGRRLRRHPEPAEMAGTR
jgi:hypothetical protein